MDSCFAFLFWLICRFNIQLNVNLFCFRLKPYDSESDESDDGLDYDDLPPLEIPESDHKLQYTYNLWFAKKGSHRASVIIKITSPNFITQLIILVGYFIILGIWKIIALHRSMWHCGAMVESVLSSGAPYRTKALSEAALV